MSISYKEAAEILSGLQDIETPKAGSLYPGAANKLLASSVRIESDLKIVDNGLNVTAMSLESCDAKELMHCYQLAIDFGVPTARRALALYQSRARF